MRRIYSGLILVLIATAFLSPHINRTTAQAGDPWSLIAEVNVLRASYGLVPYEVNNALMAAAQSHSEYMMNAGSITHSGPGGSRPHDRAVAFGYGGGAQVYVSENIAMGINLSPAGAVYEMWQDPLHLETMISSNYREIGAGVAVSGDYVYYTIVVGSPGSSTPSDGNANQAAPAPTIAIIQPVKVATPNADGSVIHVVDDGQALWHIVEAYEVPLPDLLALNGLTESAIIYPGDKLLVKATSISLTPTSEVTPTEEITPTSTRTQGPTATATKKPPTPIPTSGLPTQFALANAGSPQAKEGSLAQASIPQPDSGPDYLLGAIALLGAAGVALVLLGSVLKRSA